MRRGLGELHPTAGPEAPSTPSLAMGFFVFLSQNTLQKKNAEEVEESLRVLVAHPPPTAAFVHDSKQLH